ncbi:MAG: hypothetical protein KGK16_14505, partial [Bradyrhizobium sp.]|nr:hypothetical protein [Bradyrhizobium sp.]
RKPAMFRERLQAELREFAVLAAYLFVCFTALAAFKAAILRAYGVSFAPWVFAAVKAMLCAKFLLIGRMFGLGDGLTRTYPLIISTLFRAFAFLVVLIFLTVIEEIIMGHLRGESAAGSLADFGGGTLWQVITTGVIMLLILIPWFAFRALGEVIGDETLVRLFFEPRRRK